MIHTLLRPRRLSWLRSNYRLPPGPAAPDGGFARGALIGAIGPGGNLDVSERDASDVGGILDGGFALPAVAHGAAVPLGGTAVDPAPAAQGALVPGSAAGPSGGCGRACVV